MGRKVLVAVALAAAGCSGRVEQDDRPVFRIDPAQPFRLELGRGSGWDGLDTTRIDQDGKVVLYRSRRPEAEPQWETAALRLRPESLTEVLKAVESNGLMSLHRAYHSDVRDGTQWVFWVRQGGQEKSVYFNNRFPRSATRFAQQLDGVLDRAGLGTAAWQPVPAGESRQHERELWDSIRR